MSFIHIDIITFCHRSRDGSLLNKGVFVSSIRLLTTWSQCPFLITSSRTLDHPGTRQRTTTSTPFSLWQLCSGMRSQKMLLVRQALTYSRRQLASCNIPSPTPYATSFRRLFFAYHHAVTHPQTNIILS